MVGTVHKAKLILSIQKIETNFKKYHSSQATGKGPYLYYARSQGERGGSQIACKCVQGGRGGSQIACKCVQGGGGVLAMSMHAMGLQEAPQDPMDALYKGHWKSPFS